MGVDVYNCVAVIVRNDPVYQGNRFQFTAATAVAAVAIIIMCIPYRLMQYIQPYYYPAVTTFVCYIQLK